MEVSQARQDVKEAKDMGLDAFALNIISTEWWSTDTIRWLFEAAQQVEFKLFFSFDMNHFSHPSQFIPLLKQYCDHNAYFMYNDLPFVSACCFFSSHRLCIIPKELSRVFLFPLFPGSLVILETKTQWF